MGHNLNDSRNTMLQALIQPNIGLDCAVRQSVVDILNIALADEAVLAAKTRGACWNVRGGGFFDLHALYDIQYKQLNGISDEIAERARMLGGFSIGSFEEFLALTRLVEKPGMIPDTLVLLADHEATVRFLREDARRCAGDYEDEGTFELLVSVIRLHEKMAWMLRSYIQTDLVQGASQKGL